MLSAFLLALVAPQAAVDMPPGAIFAPSPKVSINGLPGRILEREITPLAAGACDLKDCINDKAHLGGSLAPAGFRSRNEGVDILPLSVGLVA
jgi:hypothetical protein